MPGVSGALFPPARRAFLVQSDALEDLADVEQSRRNHHQPLPQNQHQPQQSQQQPRRLRRKSSQGVSGGIAAGAGFPIIRQRAGPNILDGDYDEVTSPVAGSSGPGHVRRPSQGISGGLTSSFGQPARQQSTTDILDDFYATQETCDTDPDSRHTQQQSQQQTRSSRRKSLQGVSGGIAATASAKATRSLTDTSDALEDFLSGKSPSDPDAAAAKPTQGVVIKIMLEGKTATLCLPASLPALKFQQLVQGCLQLGSNRPTDVVGLEEECTGLVLPVSLICRDPSTLMRCGAQQVYKVLVHVDEAPAGIGPVPATHSERAEKLAKFASILQSHGYLAKTHMQRLLSIIARQPEITHAICDVYWSDPATDRLLGMLRHVSQYDDGDIELVSARIDMIDIIRLKKYPQFDSKSVNFLYLIITQEADVNDAFDTYLSERNLDAFVARVTAIDNSTSWTRTCVDVLVALHEGGHLSYTDAQLLAAKLSPPIDHFVEAAFEIFHDEGDFDEFLDTLLRICSKEKEARGLEHSANDEAFEVALEDLVFQGWLEPVESAWLLGRRAAGDPTLSFVDNHTDDGPGATMESKILQLAADYTEYLNDSKIHLSHFVEKMLNEGVLNSEQADLLSALVENSNNMIISAYEAFAFNLNADELQETLRMIAQIHQEDDGDNSKPSRTDDEPSTELGTEDEVLAQLVTMYRNENGQDPPEENLKIWTKAIAQYNSEQEKGLADDPKQEAFIRSEWEKEQIASTAAPVHEAEQSGVYIDDDECISIDEEEIHYYNDTLGYLMSDRGLAPIVATRFTRLFRASNDNIRAAFKVHEITRDDEDLLDTLSLIMEDEHDNLLQDSAPTNEQDAMTATLFQLTMAMVHNKEVTVQEGLVLRRLLLSNHDRILQIWENFSEDNDSQKLKDALRDVARNVDAIYNVSETETTDEFSDDADEGDDESHEDGQRLVEDEVDDDEVEDDDLIGLAEQDALLRSDVIASVEDFEEAEEDEALADAFAVMEPEEVTFLAAVREEQSGSHFHEVMAAAAKVYGLDQDLDSFVETLRCVVSQALQETVLTGSDDDASELQHAEDDEDEAASAEEEHKADLAEDDGYFLVENPDGQETSNQNE